LHLLFEVIAGAIFALSSGLLFTERFRRSYIAIAAASLIATTSSLFLLRDIVQQLWGLEKTTATRTWNAEGNDDFSAADLAHFGIMMQTNACRIGCKDKKFELTRLRLGKNERPIYKVTHVEEGWCGNGGCLTAVMILDNGRVYIVGEGLGMDDDEAMRIARETSTQYPNR
jgi:hypothetical protein